MLLHYCWKEFSWLLRELISCNETLSCDCSHRWMLFFTVGRSAAAWYGHWSAAMKRYCVIVHTLECWKECSLLVRELISCDCMFTLLYFKDFIQGDLMWMLNLCFAQKPSYEKTLMVELKVHLNVQKFRNIIVSLEKIRQRKVYHINLSKP